MKIVNYLRARMRKWLLEEQWLDDYIALGMRVGSGCHIQPGLVVDASHCWLIEIGDRVTIAPQVYLLAHDASTHSHTGHTRIGRVTICNDAFIGVRAIIMPGVRVGEGSIIGAGSVVTRSIPPHVVAAGVPARVICTLADYRAAVDAEFSTAPRFTAAYTLRGGITPAMKQEMIEALAPGPGFVE